MSKKPAFTVTRWNEVIGVALEDSVLIPGDPEGHHSVKLLPLPSCGEERLGVLLWGASAEMRYLTAENEFIPEATGQIIDVTCPLLCEVEIPVVIGQQFTADNGDIWTAMDNAQIGETARFRVTRNMPPRQWIQVAPEPMPEPIIIPGSPLL